MNKYSIGSKLVLLTFSLGGTQTDYPFHTYQPWRKDQYVTPADYCLVECIDEETQRFKVLLLFKDGQKCQQSDVCTPIKTSHGNDVRYFQFDTSDVRWIDSTDYLYYLNDLLNEMVMDEHNGVYTVEYDILRHQNVISRLVKFEVPTSEDLNPPQLMIPKTRFDQFCRERNPKDTQRWGQAFFNFMQAHKCVQDRSWWDRVWFAEDQYARSLVLAVLDYNQ